MKDDYKMFERSFMFRLGFHVGFVILFVASLVATLMILSLLVDIGHWARNLIF